MRQAKNQDDSGHLTAFLCVFAASLLLVGGLAPAVQGLTAPALPTSSKSSDQSNAASSNILELLVNCIGTRKFTADSTSQNMRSQAAAVQLPGTTLPNCDEVMSEIDQSLVSVEALEQDEVNQINACIGTSNTFSAQASSADTYQVDCGAIVAEVGALESTVLALTSTELSTVEDCIAAFTGGAVQSSAHTNAAARAGNCDTVATLVNGLVAEVVTLAGGEVAAVEQQISDCTGADTRFFATSSPHAAAPAYVDCQSLLATIAALEAAAIALALDGVQTVENCLASFPVAGISTPSSGSQADCQTVARDVQLVITTVTALVGPVIDTIEGCMNTFAGAVDTASILALGSGQDSTCQSLLQYVQNVIQLVESDVNGVQQDVQACIDNQQGPSGTLTNLSPTCRQVRAQADQAVALALGIARYIVDTGMNCLALDVGSPIDAPPQSAINVPSIDCQYYENQVWAVVDAVVANIVAIVVEAENLTLSCADSATSGTTSTDAVTTLSFQGTAKSLDCSWIPNDLAAVIAAVHDLEAKAIAIINSCVQDAPPDGTTPINCYELVNNLQREAERTLSALLAKVNDQVNQAQECTSPIVANPASATSNPCANASCVLNPCNAPCTVACPVPCVGTQCSTTPQSTLWAPFEGVYGRQLEATPAADGTMPSDAQHDWDADGTPDILDAVNLPSEAQRWTSAGDSLSVPSGLGPQGTLLLIEPSHHQALLAVSNLLAPAVQAIPGGIISSSQANTILSSAYGTGIANVFGMALNSGMSINLTWQAPLVALNLPLHWKGSIVPADGSWLLVRSDPTRQVSLRLGGQAAKLQPAAPSHYSAVADLDFRWEFLNLFQDSTQKSFCFDPTTYTGGSDECVGHVTPGWLRAYSGQAAYTLGNLVQGFQSKLYPVSAKRLAGTGLASAAPVPVPMFSAPAGGLTNIFDPNSSIRLYGNKSREFNPGIGVDYTIPTVVPHADPVPLVLELTKALTPATPTVPTVPSVNQVTSIATKATQSPTPTAPKSNLLNGLLGNRLFRYQARFYDIPATPRDLRHVDVSIQSADGNETGQWFLLDGRTLAEYLDVRTGTTSSESLGVTIDDAHKAGFQYVLRDVNGDGWEDIVAFVPHFSDANLKIINANKQTYTQFWDIQLTQTNSGWISGDNGYVYFYGTPQLTGVQVKDDHGNPVNQRTLGLDVISDSEFWVVGGGSPTGCPTQSSADTSPFIAHYSGGNWISGHFKHLSSISSGFACEALFDVWASDDGNLAYAGGENGMWMKYTLGTGWQVQPRPSNCAILEVSFGKTQRATDPGAGTGYVGLAKTTGQACNGGSQSDSAVMQFDGSTFHQMGVDNANGVYALQDAGGQWASGIAPSQGQAGILHQAGSWSQVYAQDYGSPYAPLPGSYFGISQAPQDTATWFAGFSGNGIGQLEEFDQGTWIHHTVSTPNTYFQGVSMAARRQGGAVGQDLFVVITPTPQIQVVDGVSPLSGDVSTQFVGQDQGSYDSTNQIPSSSLHHAWIWGDGSVDVRAASSHKYSRVQTAPYPVTQEVWYDGGTPVFGQARAVTVNPFDLNLGQQYSKTIDSGATSHDWLFRANGQSGYYQVTLDAGSASDLIIKASLNRPVVDAGSWPSGVGSQGTTLTGQLGSTDSLYVHVSNVGENAGGKSYAIHIAQVPPPAPPEVSDLVAATNSPIANYLDEVRFSVTYKDSSGQAPRDGNQVLRAPSLEIGGNAYTMVPDGSSQDFASGVSYSYTLKLPEGQGYQPVYRAWNAAGVQQSTVGNVIFVQRSQVANLDFEHDSVGALPNGFSTYNLPNHAQSLWHVTDTEALSQQGIASIGHAGKAIWFGSESTNTYADSNGGTPGGILETRPFDLRELKSPSLSFDSFYETRDTGTAYDTKSVLIRTQDTNGYWSTYQTLLQVSGANMGYREWRTLNVALSSFAGQTVQLEFVFDGVNSQNNNHVGWLVDNIVLGHDEDGDHVPDVTEQARQDWNIAPQLIPVQVSANGEARSFVRRIDRPGLDVLSLDALVQGNPDNLAISIVAVSSEEGHQGAETSTKVYANGQPAGVCQVPDTSPFADRLFTSGTPVASRRSDGVSIHANLLQCGFSLSYLDTHRDWYLDVQDAASDGGATIQMLQVSSMGHTSIRQSDTDRTGMDDGSKILQRLDPLQADQNHDGIDERLNKNTRMPHGVPVVKLTTPDFTSYVDVILSDVPGYMPQVSFSGQKGQTVTSLQWEQLSAASYRVHMPNIANLPDSITGHWADQWGTQTAVTLTMNGNARAYAPTRMDATAVDGGSTRTASWSFTNLKQPSNSAWTATMGAPALPFVSNPVGLALGVLAGIIVIGLVQAIDSTMLQQSACTDSSGCENVSSCGGLPCELPDFIKNSYNSRGFDSLNEIRDALRDMRDFVPEISGDKHWVYIGTGGLIVFIIDEAHEIVDAFKYVFPAEITLNEIRNWSYQYFMNLEKKAATDFAHDVGSALAYVSCMRFCKRTFNPELLLFYSSGAGMAVPRTQEINAPNIVLPEGTLAGLQAVIQTIKNGGVDFRFGITDHAIARLGLKVMDSLAQQDNFRQGQHLSWYWKNSTADSANTCSSNPNMRMCQTSYTVGGPTGTSAWNWLFKGQELLATTNLNWPSGQQDHLLAKGVVDVDQLYGIKEGSSPWSGLIHKMYDNNKPAAPTDKANVGGAYDFLPNEQGKNAAFEVTMDFHPQ